MPSKMNCHFLAMRVEHPASHYLLRLIAPRAHPRLGRCSHHPYIYMPSKMNCNPAAPPLLFSAQVLPFMTSLAPVMVVCCHRCFCRVLASKMNFVGVCP